MMEGVSYMMTEMMPRSLENSKMIIKELGNLQKIGNGHRTVINL
jgi:hypothetical protein